MTPHEITTMPLSALAPAPYNPREISPEALAGLSESLKRFGLVQPIVWNKRTGRVVGGHQRVKALEAAGVVEAQVVVVDLPEREEKALNLTLNNPAVAGEFTTALGPLLSELETLELPEFDALRLTQMESLIPKAVVDIVEDEVPEPPAVAVTKPGDLWELGAHRLLCGDALEAETLARLYAGRADAVITDPPYGIGLDTNYRSMGTRSGKHILQGVMPSRFEKVIGDDRPFDASLVARFFAAVREQFWFGADYYRRTLPADDLSGSWLVWDKRNDDSDAGFGSGFELIWSRERHKRDVLRVYWFGAFGPADARHRVHPTQKPVALIGKIMERWTAADALVADPFLGSGTTLIAAEQLSRRCSGLEIEPRYCDVIVERWQNLTGGKAKRA